MSPLLNLRTHCQRNLYSHPYYRSTLAGNQQVSQVSFNPSSTFLNKSDLNHVGRVSSLCPINSAIPIGSGKDENNNAGTTALTKLNSSPLKVDTMQKFSTLPSQSCSSVHGDVSFAVPSQQKRIRINPYASASVPSTYSNEHVSINSSVKKTNHKYVKNDSFNDLKTASADVNISTKSIRINHNRLNFVSTPTDCVVDYAIVNQNNHIGSDIQDYSQLFSQQTATQPTAGSTKMPIISINSTHSTTSVHSNYYNTNRINSSASLDKSNLKLCSAEKSAMQHSPSRHSSSQLGFGQLISMSSDAVCHDSMQTWTPSVGQCTFSPSVDIANYNGFEPVSSGNLFHEYSSSPAHSTHSLSSQYSAGGSSGRSSPNYAVNASGFVGRAGREFDSTVESRLPSANNESSKEQYNYQQRTHTHYMPDSSCVEQPHLYQPKFGQHSNNSSDSKRSTPNENSTDNFVLKRNERERTRVRFVNDGFEMLREHLPFESSKRISKVQTLKLAINYIRQLEQELGLDSETLFEHNE